MGRGVGAGEGLRGGRVEGVGVERALYTAAAAGDATGDPLIAYIRWF